MTINIESITKGLSLEQLESLSEYLLAELASKQEESSTYTEEAHLYSGIVCPNCGSVSCIKNGTVRDKQRFLCRDCYKTFGYTTKSAISSTKLTNEQWKNYIKCMIQGMSIRKSAEIVGISVKTSFKERF